MLFELVTSAERTEQRCYGGLDYLDVRQDDLGYRTLPIGGYHSS